MVLAPSGPARALFKIAPGNFVLVLFPSAFGGGRCNVPVNAPSPRIHARRPGLRKTTQRFTAGPGQRGKKRKVNGITAKRQVDGNQTPQNSLSFAVFFLKTFRH
jgi:hypothetical protein